MSKTFRLDNLPISCQQVSLESDDIRTRFVNLPQYLQRVNINTKHVYDIKMRNNRRLPYLFINIIEMPRCMNYMKYMELAIGYLHNSTNDASHYISTRNLCNIIKGYHRGTDYDSKDLKKLRFECSLNVTKYMCWRLLSTMDNVQPQLRTIKGMQSNEHYNFIFELVDILLAIDKSSSRGALESEVTFNSTTHSRLLHNTGLKLNVLHRDGNWI